MSLKYIRETYGVPAKLKACIKFSPCGDFSKEVRHGRITGSDGARLRVKFEADKQIRLLHPVWSVVYI